MSDITLILGGARSGKSKFGEETALGTGLVPIYIATAEACDQEMKDRIAHHKTSRDDSWSIIEEPLALSSLIKKEAGPDKILFIDCLTIWLSNHLIKGSDLRKIRDEFTTSLKNTAGPIILVANEVGAGIVPTHAMGRKFRDEAGRLNQELSQISKDVFYIVAGLPLPLKKEGQQIHTFEF